eukprot:TRINITY_DN9516_c0_g8_i1.p1 TRINITY_DN9516_c0_g8~~TRINITY_DN9516_c0_g8_i1.p1  ORF type:complete len:452 (-),score=163.18 TRINITY_DN9516_c0_g8_i1:484-1773(-)
MANSELVEEVQRMKVEIANLKSDNASLNATVQELLVSNGDQGSGKKEVPFIRIPKTSGMTATGHLVFGDPIARIQELMKKKVDTDELNEFLKNIKEYLQHHMKKCKILLQKLAEKKAEVSEMQRENNILKIQCAKVRTAEGVVKRQARFNINNKRTLLKQFKLRALTFLPIEDLLKTSLVCRAFRAKTQELLQNTSTWSMECTKGFTMIRNKLWKYFIIYQRPHVISLIKEKLSQDVKVSPIKEVSTKNKAGFFDFNYSAFENVEALKPDSAHFVDYSLMNVEVGHCNPRELFAAEFLSYFAFGLPAKEAAAESEKIEKLVMETQQMFGFLHHTQALSVIVCFLYVALRRRKVEVQRIVGMLLDEPYHLRKLYSDDYYLLNLIIFQIDYLMQQKIPELYFHLKEQGIDSHDFMVDWVLTLLTYQVFFCV